MKKNSDSNRPRLICRVAQGWMAWAGDGLKPAPGGWCARHVDTCGGCQRHLRECDELAASLRRGAERQRQTVPPGLEARIVETLHHSSRPPVRPFSPWNTLPALGAGAATLLAIAIFLKSVGPEREPGPGAIDSPSPAEEMADVSVTAPLWASLRPSAGALLDGEPLQREVDAVYADARSAIDFLALNFLPSVTPEKDGTVAAPSSRGRTVDG